jgi:phosphoglycerate kinase
MNVKDLNDLNLNSSQVILRCDLNVPIKNGEILDDGRIKASLPTIKKLLAADCSIVIIAHLGRPKGVRSSDLSLSPVAKRLSELLKTPVEFCDEIRGQGIRARALKPGQILLLENIRFEEAETNKDENLRQGLAQELSSYGDFYIGDGFGAVHRKHASVFELAKLLPNAAGDLVSAEIKVLERLTNQPQRPYGVVLGGAKVSDKIAVISNLLNKVDLLAIGGGMVFTFLAAQGKEIGKSLVEPDLFPVVRELLERAQSLGVKILLPTDIAVGNEFSDKAIATLVSVDTIKPDQMGLDIGEVSARNFASEIVKCKTVFWNGPMGVFEFSNFSNGTRVVAQALTEVSGLSVVGGGDSAAAVRQLGFNDNSFGYISTGGGASLEYLEGKELPGLIALSQGRDA